jgi:hypothetical protein
MRNQPTSDNLLHFPRRDAAKPNLPPAGTTKTDPRKATFWTWLSSCLMEGFALYGASHYPPALYLFDIYPTNEKDRRPAEYPPAFPNAIVDPQED